MEKKISSYQLFAAVFLVPYGSAALYYLAAEAKQDAWISMIFYIIPGILLQLIYIALFKYYPEDSLVMYLPKIFGKYVGAALSFIYILYFAYMVARLLRSLAGLVTTATSPHTSLFFLEILLMLTVSFGIMTGIKTICRAAEILFPLFMIGLFVSYMLLFATKNIVVFNRLLPIMENGPIYDIVKSWGLVTFPFSEPIVFTMLYNIVKEPEKIRKVILWATITEGIVLSSLTIMTIATLGVTYASATNFPLLEGLRMIKVGGFLDRMDILIIVTLIAGGFFKMCVFMYVSILGAAQLFKVKEQNHLIIPFSIIIIISSNLIARNYPQHVNRGFDFTLKYIQLPLHIVVPIIALIIAWFKNKKS